MFEKKKGRGKDNCDIDRVEKAAKAKSNRREEKRTAENFSAAIGDIHHLKALKGGGGKGDRKTETEEEVFKGSQ